MDTQLAVVSGDAAAATTGPLTALTALTAPLPSPRSLRRLPACPPGAARQPERRRRGGLVLPFACVPCAFSLAD
eukprot:2003801-Prymnesium_polylepis.2